MTRSGRGTALAERGAGAGPVSPPPRARYRRRRLLALLVLAALLVIATLVGGHALLLHSSRFQVARIEVSGPADIDPDTVRVATGIRLGQPLLSVDPEQAGRAVAGLPKVAAAQVSRGWPATVRVTLTGRTPVALTASSSGPRLVDRTGLAYQAAARPPPALPELASDRVAPGDPATEAGLAVMAALPDPLRGKLRQVRADGPSSVTLELAGDKQVLWGAPSDSARKAAVLAVLLSQRGSVYDVSAPDLPTIRR